MIAKGKSSPGSCTRCYWVVMAFYVSHTYPSHCSWPPSSLNPPPILPLPLLLQSLNTLQWLLSSTPTTTYKLKVSQDGTLPTFVEDTRVIKCPAARGYYWGVAKIRNIGCEWGYYHRKERRSHNVSAKCSENSKEEWKRLSARPGPGTNPVLGIRSIWIRLLTSIVMDTTRPARHLL